MMNNIVNISIKALTNHAPLDIEYHLISLSLLQLSKGRLIT